MLKTKHLFVSFHGATPDLFHVKQIETRQLSVPSQMQIRVKEGGHDVPTDKIVSRYYRSLNNLLGAVRSTDRAFVFDNSGAEAILVAEITNGKDIEIRNSNVPVWFRKHVLDKGA